MGRDSQSRLKPACRRFDLGGGALEDGGDPLLLGERCARLLDQRRLERVPCRAQLGLAHRSVPAVAMT